MASNECGKLGYLEAGLDDTVASGDDPLVDNEPELARMLAVSIPLCMTSVNKPIRMSGVWGRP